MQHRGRILLALVLIAAGSYLFLDAVGTSVPDWQSIWPALPIAGGLTLLIGDFIAPKRDPDAVFLGVVVALAGFLFLGVTAGPITYTSLGTWWPAFVLIAGIGFLARWAAARFADWDALFLGLVAASAGAVGIATMLRLLGPNTRDLLPALWPAALILIGLMALIRGLVGRQPR